MPELPEVIRPTEKQARQFLMVGPLMQLTHRAGVGQELGFGFELSYQFKLFNEPKGDESSCLSFDFSSITGPGIGAYGQFEAIDFDRVRGSLGFEATWFVTGLELGASLQGQEVVVPGDISSAAFWLVAGAITPGAELTVENVGLNPSRTGILDVLKQMGARIEVLNSRDVAGEPVGDLRVSHGPLQAFNIGADLIPRLVDEIPVLAVAACFAEGISRVTSAEELRVKETDRLAVMARQLGAMGARIEEFDDGMTIQGGVSLHGAEVDSETDHRVAMSLAVAAQIASGATTLHRPEAAAVSYPTFWDDLERLQA